MVSMRHQHGKIITEGELNKNKIFEFISRNNLGETPDSIHKHLRISLHTVHTHLNELLDEKKIYKKNRRYYARDFDLANIFNFSEHMKSASNLMFDLSLIEPMNTAFKDTYADSLVDTAYSDFCKRLKGNSVSSKYVTTNFTESDIHEKYLFELVNRIGGFITYIFIEAMRPSSRYYNDKKSAISIKKKEMLSTTLFHKAIDLDSIFVKVCYLFSIVGLFKNTPISPNDLDDSFFNLDEDNFDKISETFRRLYPGIYEGLEKFWSDSIQQPILWTSSLVRDNEIKCTRHTWEGFHIYKLGDDNKYSVCRKCGSIIDLSITKKN